MGELTPTEMYEAEQTRLRGAARTPLTPVTGVTRNRVEPADELRVTGVTGTGDGIRRGDQLMTSTFPELAWHVPHLIPEGFTLLVGAPKIGKSWLLQAIALAAASGGNALGERLAPRPVLHLALEDSDRRLQARSRSLGYGVTDAPLLADWHYLTRVPPERIASAVIRDWLDRLPDACPAPLVFVDTFGRVKGARLSNESPYDHDYRIGAAMKQLAESMTGLAFVAAHHDRKAQSADFVDDVSGTNGLAGSADTIVVLRRDRHNSEGVVLVTGRDVEEAAYGVALSERGVWSLVGGDWDSARTAAAQINASTGRGDLAARIVSWLADNITGTPSMVAEALDENPNTVRQSLWRMFRSNVVDKDDRGNYFLPGKA